MKLSKNAQTVYEAIVAITEEPLRICDSRSIWADTGISENRLRGYITHLKKVGLVEEKRIGYDLQIVPVNFDTTKKCGGSSLESYGFGD
jgi:DNA-binding IscR family transcriptional regulator|tara:strand:- start:7464 stop:7730 length:267 start_codon:yes stop_codon:yes gene_type:complete